MSASHLTRIDLSDAERSVIVRRPDKVAYVGIAYFRGPRGRIYRPIRTKVTVTEQGLERELAAIRSKRYAHGAFISHTVVCLVDHLGDVVEA